MCVPSPNFFTGFTSFLSQAPAEPWQLTPSPSVQLSRRLIQPGESPGRARGGGAVRGGGPGLRGAPPSPGVRFSLVPPRTFPPTKWGRRQVERANKVRLQSPQDESFVGCWSSLFARNLKVIVADTLAILLPAHFRWRPLFGRPRTYFFSPCFVTICKRST